MITEHDFYHHQYKIDRLVSIPSLRTRLELSLQKIKTLSARYRFASLVDHPTKKVCVMVDSHEMGIDMESNGSA
jgi:hypothetical protein